MRMTANDFLKAERDFVIRVKNFSNFKQFIVLLFNRYWPDWVYGDIADSEFCVHKSQETKALWDELGWSKEHQNTLILVIRIPIELDHYMVCFEASSEEDHKFFDEVCNNLLANQSLFGG